MELLKRANFLQWVLSGCLLGVGFVFPALWVLGIVGVISCIHLTIRTSSFKKVILGSFTAWTIKSALAIIWFWSVYPIEWLAFDLGKIQLVIIFFYWLTAAAWLGVGGIIFTLLTRNVHQTFNLPIVLMGVPVFWVVSEILGSLFFSVVTIGEGGSVTSAFSFGFIGYLLAQHTLLIYIAHWYGVYALGIVIVAIASGLVWLLYQPSAKKIYILGVILLIYGTGFIAVSSTEQENTDVHHVVVIDTDFPPNQIRTESGAQHIAQEIENAMEVALKVQPDYILLPEDTRYFNQNQNPNQTKSLFRFQHKNPQTIIVDTSRAQFEDQTVLQSYVYNGQVNTVDQSHKRYLVPQGEFMPSLYISVLKLFGYSDLVAGISKDIAFEVGPDTSQADFADSSPGVLFCFESVSPWGVRQIIAERGSVPFIAHPISHAWFHESTILWNSLDTMLRVQAIWTGQYIVSAGGHVEGKVITPAGVIRPLDILSTGNEWQVKQTFIPKQ